MGEKDDDVLAARVREDLEALGGRLRALPGSNPAMAAKKRAEAARKALEKKQAEEEGDPTIGWEEHMRLNW